MPYKAVFIDMDGTLLRSDHSVSETTRVVLQKLKQKHILVVIVSARPLHGIIPICKEIDLLDSPIASLNGSYITLNEKVIFEASINVSLLNELDKYLLGYNTTIIYYQQMQWFTQINNDLVIKEQKITKTPIIIQPYSKTLKKWEDDNTGPNKILIISDAETINKMQDNLKNVFINRLNISTSKPTYLELMNKGASKENAVKFIIEYYNIRSEDVIAIGDNYNDIGMIHFAGTGIAMDNAPDEVKQHADYITDNNNNDGVAKALTKFFDL